MLPLRYARQWWTASVVLLFLVVLVMLMPTAWMWPDRAEFVAWFADADKWVHAIIFCILAIWFAGQYRAESYWRIALGLLLFGLLTEACQRLVAYRSADWFDLAADAAGIIVGLSVATAGAGGWSLRIENWVDRRKASVDLD